MKYHFDVFVTRIEYCSSIERKRMILVWNDAKSFNRHLVNMMAFRRLHRAKVDHSWNLLKDMPVAQDIQPVYNAGGGNRFFRANSRAIIVPIWKIKIPANQQN